MAEGFEVAKVDSDIHKLAAFGIMDILKKLVGVVFGLRTNVAPTSAVSF